MTAPVLEGLSLEKRFGETIALRGLDFQLSEGEMVAVMGPSGSGKSTLLHCLAGILRPDSGEVRLRGERVDDLDEERRTKLRRQNFGFVFQFGQLVAELPARENVALPLLLDRVPRREAMDRSEEALRRLGVADVAERRCGDMSGGQSQRVAVARALVVRPSVVFADEPTGALDSVNGARVMEELVARAREDHAAIVLVTHDPLVAGYADRVVEVRDGLVRPVVAA